MSAKVAGMVPAAVVVVDVSDPHFVPYGNSLVAVAIISFMASCEHLIFVFSFSFFSVEVTLLCFEEKENCWSPIKVRRDDDETIHGLQVVFKCDK